MATFTFYFATLKAISSWLARWSQSGGRAHCFTAEEMVFKVPWPGRSRLRTQTRDLDPQTIGVLRSTLPSLPSLCVTLFSPRLELASVGEGRTFPPPSCHLETKTQLTGPTERCLFGQPRHTAASYRAYN